MKYTARQQIVKMVTSKRRIVAPPTPATNGNRKALVPTGEGPVTVVSGSSTGVAGAIIC